MESTKVGSCSPSGMKWVGCKAWPGALLRRRALQKGRTAGLACVGAGGQAGGLTGSGGRDRLRRAGQRSGRCAARAAVDVAASAPGGVDRRARPRSAAAAKYTRVLCHSSTFSVLFTA